jgi:hypothetical protein
MARRGRPTKLTRRVHAEILESLEGGNYLETAAAFAGVTKQSVHNWIRLGRQLSGRLEAGEKMGELTTDERRLVRFFDEVLIARAAGEMKLVGQIDDAATHDWRAAAWRLERMFPERYGRVDRVVASLEAEGDEEVAETEEVKALARRDLALRVISMVQRLEAASIEGDG